MKDYWTIGIGRLLFGLGIVGIVMNTQVIFTSLFSLFIMVFGVILWTIGEKERE